MEKPQASPGKRGLRGDYESLSASPLPTRKAEPEPEPEPEP